MDLIDLQERFKSLEENLQSHSHAWNDISYKPNVFLNSPALRVLASDFNNSASTLLDVTGLTIPIGANEAWKFELFGRYQTADAATGAGLSLTAPSGATIGGRVWFRQGSDGTDGFWETEILTSGADTTSANVVAQNVPYSCGFSIYVSNGTMTGNVQVQFRSENTNQARLLAGTAFIGIRLA
jgi:hypothetical protein